MPLLDLLVTMFWLFLFIAWIWLVISIFIDIFRSDMSGWAKAGWIILVLLLPLLGVLLYVIVHGKSMTERRAGDYRRQEEATQQYIRDAAGTGPSTADEIAKLTKLRDDGTLTDEEYQAQKAKLLA